jgi:hypothetical protein
LHRPGAALIFFSDSKVDNQSPIRLGQTVVADRRDYPPGPAPGRPDKHN